MIVPEKDPQKNQRTAENVRKSWNSFWVKVCWRKTEFRTILQETLVQEETVRESNFRCHFSLPKTKQIHRCFINRTILVQRNRKKYKLEQDATNSTTGIHRLSHLNWFKLAWYKIPVQFYVRASMQFSQQIFLSLYRLINHENERIKKFKRDYIIL